MAATVGCALLLYLLPPSVDCDVKLSCVAAVLLVTAVVLFVARPYRYHSETVLIAFVLVLLAALSVVMARQHNASAAGLEVAQTILVLAIAALITIRAIISIACTVLEYKYWRHFQSQIVNDLDEDLVNGARDVTGDIYVGDDGVLLLPSPNGTTRRNKGSGGEKASSGAASAATVGTLSPAPPLSENEPTACNGNSVSSENGEEADEESDNFNVSFDESDVSSSQSPSPSTPHSAPLSLSNSSFSSSDGSVPVGVELSDDEDFL